MINNKDFLFQDPFTTSEPSTPKSYLENCNLGKYFITYLKNLGIRTAIIEDYIDTSNIISEFTQELVLNQDDSIKEVILRELGEDKIRVYSLENICERIRQIQLESSRDFIKNYRIKIALL